MTEKLTKGKRHDFKHLRKLGYACLAVPEKFGKELSIQEPL